MKWLWRISMQNIELRKGTSRITHYKHRQVIDFDYNSSSFTISMNRWMKFTLFSRMRLFIYYHDHIFIER